MINTLNKPIYDEFLLNVAACKKSIMLCAPYIKQDVIYDIYSIVNSDIKINVLTNINIASFINKASDISAIKNLVQHKHSVFNYPNLHAKFYIFDYKKLIITSSNLTSSGLKRNFEYGIITDNNDMVNTAINDFKKHSTDELAGKVLLSHLDTINNLISKLNIQNDYEKHVEIYDYIKDDDLLSVKEALLISNILKGWMKTTFEIVSQLKSEVFKINDIYDFLPYLKDKYPDNHNLEAKLRQQLQLLRNIGLIKFVSRGVYKKLWRGL